MNNAAGAEGLPLLLGNFVAKGFGILTSVIRGKVGDLVSVNEWELCVSDLYVRDRQLISF